MSKGYHTQAHELGEAIYEKGCRGKRHYVSRRRANGAIRVLVQSGAIPDDGTMNAYKCRSCRTWHIGHKPGSGVLLHTSSECEHSRGHDTAKP